MNPPVFRFEPFLLDIGARELRRDGEPLTLPASAFDCLAYLITHRHRAVGRDELIAAVWGRTDVSDTVLGQTVLKVRRSLGGRDDPQRWIRTVPRFGYHWTAPVDVVDAKSVGGIRTQPDPDPAHEAALPTMAPGRPRWLAIAGLVLLGLVAISWFASGWRPWNELAGDRIERLPDGSAAILPVHIDAGVEHGWLRLGLMDLIADRLRRAGIATLPSESVLGLLREHSAGNEADAEIAIGDLTTWQMRASASSDDQGWRIEIEARSGAVRFNASADDDDPVQATRDAVDVVLARLGRMPPAETPGPPGLDELLQRTRAAMLADQFDLAQTQIEQAPSDLQSRPELLHRRAQIELRAGDYPETERLLTGLLAGLPAGIDDALRARALITLAASHVRRQHPDAAETAYREALVLLDADPNPDRATLGLAYLGRGLVAAMRGRLELATEDLGRARIQMQSAGDALGLAQVDLNLGVFDVLRQRPADGHASLMRAAERFERLGAREELVYTLNAIAEVDSSLLQHEQALALSDRIWPPEVHSGNVRMRWDLVLVRAQILFDLGRLTEARTLLEELLAHADADLDRSRRTRASGLLAALALEGGLPAQAAAIAGRTLAMIAEYSHSADAQRDLRTWLMRLRALHELGKTDTAGSELERMRAWTTAYGGAWAQVYLPLAEAEHAWAEGDPARALSRFDQAMVQAEALAVPDALVEVAHRHVLVLIEHGDSDRAQAIAGRIAPWSESDVRAAWSQAMVFQALGHAEAAERAAVASRRLAGERRLLTTVHVATLPSR